MKRPRAEELQTILAEGRLDREVTILQRLDPTVAADTLPSLPYEDQQVLLNEVRILNLQLADANVDLAVVRHAHDVSVRVLNRTGGVEIAIVM